jgi:hypothetical protein
LFSRLKRKDRQQPEGYYRPYLSVTRHYTGTGNPEGLLGSRSFFSRSGFSSSFAFSRSGFSSGVAFSRSGFSSHRVFGNSGFVSGGVGGSFFSRLRASGGGEGEAGDGDESDLLHVVSPERPDGRALKNGSAKCDPTVRALPNHGRNVAAFSRQFGNAPSLSLLFPPAIPVLAALFVASCLIAGQIRRDGLALVRGSVIDTGNAGRQANRFGPGDRENA